MNPRIAILVALLLPVFAGADDRAAQTPKPKPEPRNSTADARAPAPKPPLDLEFRRQLELDDQVMRNLERAATREPDLSAQKLFRTPGEDIPFDSRMSITLRPVGPQSAFTDRASTRCQMNVCRVYDDRGREMYSYREARLGIDVPATREMWDSCQARQNDMLSTFERADRCSGIHSHGPTPWDPAPRAWP